MHRATVVPALCFLVIAACAGTTAQAASNGFNADPPTVAITDLPVDILHDQQRIWTSPFHMNRKNAIWWAAFAAATAALMETDHITAKELPNTPQQVRWGNDFSRIGASYSVAGLAGGYYAVGLLTDDAHARETGLLSGEALIDALVVVEVLKLSVGRERPNVTGGEAGSFFDGGASFPSGHTISAWALASVIAHEYPSKKVALLAYGLASVVGAARFTAREHFLSDIVAGGAMGWFIGRSVYDEHSPEGHRIHLEKQIRPIFDAGTRTYGIALALQPRP